MYNELKEEEEDMGRKIKVSTDLLFTEFRILLHYWSSEFKRTIIKKRKKYWEEGYLCHFCGGMCGVERVGENSYST